MFGQHASYSGVDSFTISDYGNFSKHSVMLRDQEALSVACRSDINHLLDRFVYEGNITKAFALDVRTRAAMYYRRDSVTKYIQGATYVSLCDRMSLQKAMSEDDGVEVIDLRAGGKVERRVVLSRSWVQHINIIQKEDSLGYGYPFEPIVPVTSALFVFLL